MKLINQISYKDAHLGSRIIHDYIDGKCHDLIRTPSGINNFQEQIDSRKYFNVNRKILVEALEDQNKIINLSSLTKENIHYLSKENTYTITTGHQLNLFTGPLYFVYKIASVIKTCTEAKKKFPSFNFVPVYWMNSEDHDFAEINHFYLFGEKISWDVDSKKQSAGDILMYDFDVVIEKVKSTYSNGTPEIVERFISYYSSSKNLAEAHRKIVNELFAEYGLVILDQNDKRLKREFISHFKNDFFDAVSFKHVSETNKLLESNGIDPQVNVREVNSFYLGEGIRDRIEKQEDYFITVESKKKWSVDELANEIENYPENFSPNVVLRPMYQEVILPNLAYIGGPGEIAYWLQYKANFDAQAVHFPMLVLRDSFLIVQEKWNDKLAKLNLKLDDLFASIDDIVKTFVHNNYGDEIQLTEFQNKIQHIYSEIEQKAIAIDSSFGTMINAELQKSLNSIKQIESKLQKSIKQKSEQQIKTITDIHTKIFPEKSFQERIESIFSLNIDLKKFIGDIIELSDIDNVNLKIIQS